MKKIYFHTYGCRLNQSETAVIERSFEVSGYKIVDFKDSPDIVVVNTCTVTENGDAETRRLVTKINRVNPSARIALVGCQAQIQKEKLATLPNVKWIVGNARKMELAEIISKFADPQKPEIITPAISRESFTLASAGFDRTHTRASLKIQDGCDFFCSFCEIPFARGRARSREFDDILLEARALVTAKHKELVLTGINLGTYNFKGKTILDVLDGLEEIEGLSRIRISSIEPTTIPFELIERMGTTKLCRYLHIPLQSGSNDILKSMERKYTVEEFTDFILRAHKAIPEICIGTDVIVGFPGETEAHFEETAALIRRLPLSYVHVFSYSDRTHSKSSNLKDKVPISIIQKRSAILRELSQRNHRVYMQNFVGTAQDVLFETKEGAHWPGLTDNYLRVKVSSSQNLKNQLIPARLSKISGQNLVGNV